MKFTIGQKVKFLNEVGGGVITKIISPTMVSVTTEDGFDMPYITSDLIPAFSSDSAGKMFDPKETDFSTAIQPSDSNRDVDENDYERETPLDRFSSAKKDPIGIYLCFVPHDQVWLLKDDLDVYVVNNTNYVVLYNLMINNQENLWEGIDYGSINPNSKMLINTIQRDDINKWIKGALQVIFHSELDQRVHLPINDMFTIKSSKFFNKDSYHSCSFLASKSVVINVGSIPEFVQTNREELQKYDELTVAETTSRNIVTSVSMLKNFMTDSGVAEVDLHIEALVDNPSEIDTVQMLTIQTSTFNKYLEEAIRLKLQKIIFIHGVGIGRLKSEILKILQQYPNLHHFDAPISKYGSGATEVWIKD